VLALREQAQGSAFERDLKPLGPFRLGVLVFV
jgi:hypothetical protein